MHFALPPRKVSRPPPYVASRPAPYSHRRRRRWKIAAWIIIAVLFFIILLSQFNRGRSRHDKQQKIPPNTPHTILVTVFDQNITDASRALVLDNRIQYAAKHGYAVFTANASDYELGFKATAKDKQLTAAPTSWAKIPTLRHAMSKHSHSTYFFFLDQRSFIVNPHYSVEAHIMDDPRLETIMQPNQPVIPPSSVIKTPNFRNPSAVDVVMTQDHEGLRQETFIVRQGQWAKFFLDSWFDPLYRSYNFQRAEGHALEHLVQWHPTVLAKMCIVPQRIMNSYYVGAPEEIYQDGDFVVNLIGCERRADGSCEEEAKTVIEQFKARLKESQPHPLPNAV